MNWTTLRLGVFPPWIDSLFIAAAGVDLGVPSGFIGVKGKCFNVIIYMLYGVVFCLEVNAWIFLANILHLDLL